LSCHSVAVVLTLAQTKQIRINIHKRNNTKNTVQTTQNTVNTIAHRPFTSYQLKAHFLYSITIYMLHYNPQHVSSSILLILRRTNCIITASDIVTLCKQPYSVPVESGTDILYGCLQRVTMPEAVII